MPNLPNPYGPATQIGSGLQDVSNAIFNVGRMQGIGRYYRQRTEQQNAEDAANAEKLLADKRKAIADAVEQERINAATSPEALQNYGATIAGLPRDVFRRATDLQMGHMPEGPIPEYGDITPEHQQATIPANIAVAHFAANPKIDPTQLFKALQQRQQNIDYQRAMNGTLSTDTLGDVTAASDGKPRYGVSDGTRYSNQVEGRYETTPVGKSTITKNQAAAGASGAQAGKSKAETKRINSGQFGPQVTVDKDGKPVARFLGQVADTDMTAVAPPKLFAPKSDKKKPLAKGNVTVMKSHLADTIGTDFENIDPPSRAAILGRAEQLATDPDSDWHQNPMGAVEAAVSEYAPEGFEDTGGYFSTKFTPKGGGTTTQARTGTTPPAPSKQPAAPGLPDGAKAQLKENQVTTFKNGQTWTLQNGVAVQVR